MSDYEIIGVDQTKDLVTHFALFVGCDPITFESTIKELDGKRQWMMKLNSLKEITHGSYLIFQKGKNPFV